MSISATTSSEQAAHFQAVHEGAAGDEHGAIAKALQQVDGFLLALPAGSSREDWELSSTVPLSFTRG